MRDPREIAGTDAGSGTDRPQRDRGQADDQLDLPSNDEDLPLAPDGDLGGADDDSSLVDEIAPETNDDLPVFDRADELPIPEDESLSVDDENNLLPGNDPEDDDPNDNGEEEQNDPEDLRAKVIRGQPIE